MKTITIGSLTISQQAFIVAITGLVVGLVLLVTLPKGFKVLGLISILTSFVASYNVNCTLVGQCVVWAWVLTAMAIFNAVVYVVLAFTNKDRLRQIYTAKSSSTVFSK